MHILPYFEDEIVFVDERDEGKFIKADGLITCSQNLVLSLCPADCAPVMITDINFSFLCLLHVGKKNIYIIQKAMEEIKNKLGVEEENLMVGIGPAIKDCCYEIDMQRSVSGLFEERRVPKKQIFLAKYCTCCAKENGNYLFFSHRRSKLKNEKEGRFIVIASL